MAKGRTGLAFLRTGIALVMVSVTFMRMFGVGHFLPLDLLLIAVGIAAIFDGLRWYVPVRRNASTRAEQLRANWGN